MRSVIEPSMAALCACRCGLLNPTEEQGEPCPKCGQKNYLDSRPYRSPALRRASPALRIPTVQARHAAVHLHDGGGAALATQLRAFREVALCKRVGLLVARLE